MSEISKELWSSCKVCGKTIKEIKKQAGGSGVYNCDAFVSHIHSHGITMEDYFHRYEGIEMPPCPCGICGKRVPVVTNRNKIRGLYIGKFACGRNPGLLKWSVEAKEGRKGKNNPMYGKDSWNKGQTKDTNEVVKRLANSLVGKKATEETRRKQSESAKKRKIHGHTGYKHSEAAREKLSRANIDKIRRGVFKQTRSKPHLAMADLLTRMGLRFEEERGIWFYSFDFYLVDYDVYIEVDGDYFHSNPDRYPDGPQTKTQKANAARDKRKDSFCQSNAISLMRFWESHILRNPDEVERQIWHNLKRSCPSSPRA